MLDADVSVDVAAVDEAAASVLVEDEAAVSVEVATGALSEEVPAVEVAAIELSVLVEASDEDAVEVEVDVAAISVLDALSVELASVLDESDDWIAEEFPEESDDKT